MLQMIRMLFVFMALFHFSSVYSLELPTEASGRHKELCAEEHTKRGKLDQDMYRYCMNDQHEGYLDFVALAKKYSNQPWIQPLVDYAINEWTKRGIRNDRMVHFELNQNTEGYEDLVYMSNQPGWNQSKYQSCANEWGIRFGMIVFCIKNL